VARHANPYPDSYPPTVPDAIPPNCRAPSPKPRSARIVSAVSAKYRPPNRLTTPTPVSIMALSVWPSSRYATALAPAKPAEKASQGS